MKTFENFQTFFVILPMMFNGHIPTERITITNYKCER